MSLRSGNNIKKGQKHQNTYAFHHNKGSLISRKIQSSPLDLLCEKCLSIMEWKIKYNKYHPLKNPGKCNKCLEKNIYKAYRTICDKCAVREDKKYCTKCGEEVSEFAKPSSRNNPEAGIKKKSPVMEVVKNLKKKYQKTVYRKINKGVRIEYDEIKGIVDEQTKEVIISMDKIIKDDGEDDDEEEDDKDEEEDKNEENEENNEKEGVIDTNNENKDEENNNKE